MYIKKPKYNWYNYEETVISTHKNKQLSNVSIYVVLFNVN